MDSMAAATLKSDIQSAKVIENALSFYVSEKGETITNENLNDAIKYLVENSYLKTNAIKPQSKESKWVYEDTTLASISTPKPKVVKVQITGSESDYDRYLSGLSDADKDYVKVTAPTS